ncbi:MAG: hypothetical protein GYA17_02265 [Chloroflexi bacterium]|nr:hypothetical protein [Anaerolineaceae bacterium]NMB87153.1 hypothetical protein [Chloroflexota bacterium]
MIYDPATNQVTVIFTEQQLTGYVISALASNPDIPLTDPQVNLTNGQAEIYGQFEQGILSANVRLVATISVNAEGGLEPELVSADLGPVPVTSQMLDTISSALDESFSTSLNPGSTGIRAQSVTITEGLVTVTGTQQ